MLCYTFGFFYSYLQSNCICLVKTLLMGNIYYTDDITKHVNIMNSLCATNSHGVDYKKGTFKYLTIDDYLLVLAPPLPSK
jgi:hypothetical protein